MTNHSVTPKTEQTTHPPEAKVSTRETLIRKLPNGKKRKAKKPKHLRSSSPGWSPRLNDSSQCPSPATTLPEPFSEQNVNGPPPHEDERKIVYSSCIGDLIYSSDESDSTPDDSSSLLIVNTKQADTCKSKSQTTTPYKRVRKGSSSSKQADSMDSDCSGCADIAFCKSFETREKEVSKKRNAVKRISADIVKLEDMLTKKRSESVAARKELESAVSRLSKMINRHV